LQKYSGKDYGKKKRVPTFVVLIKRHET
jgi:hypothetical protein